MNTLGTTGTPVLSFNVDFYSNSAGVPGSLLFSNNVSFTESVAGTIDLFANGQTETVYNYSASLSTGFTAAANTKYRVSVQAVTDYPAYWTWTSGSGGDGTSYQTENPAYGSVNQTRPGDRAFSLSVPEPSSFALCAIAGSLGLVIARVRGLIRRE